MLILFFEHDRGAVGEVVQLSELEHISHNALDRTTMGHDSKRVKRGVDDFFKSYLDA